MINFYSKVMNYFGGLIPDGWEVWLLVGEERKGFGYGQGSWVEKDMGSDWDAAELI